MTREALKKLNKKQMNYCQTLSVLIAKDREDGVKEQHENDCGKLKGYLECLEGMKVPLSDIVSANSGIIRLLTM